MQDPSPTAPRDPVGDARDLTGTMFVLDATPEADAVLAAQFRGRYADVGGWCSSEGAVRHFYQSGRSMCRTPGRGLTVDPR